MSGPRIVHLSIGDELLIGRHPDLDAPIVAAELEARGLSMDEVRVLRDDPERLVSTLRELRSAADLVITSGGLGPTEDDITREVVAEAWGLPLEECPDAWAEVRAWFTGRGIEPAEANRRQAHFPRGAATLSNRHGTAPGFWLDPADGGAGLCSLPGPPRELRGMLEDGVAERIAAAFGGGVHAVRREVSLFGLSESVLAERVGDWMGRDQDPLMGVSAREGLLVIGVSSHGEDAATRVEARLDEVRERFAEYVFAEGARRLDAVLAEELLARGTTVALAESCTGGRVAAALTRHAGISSSFLEGAVTYSNAAKQRTLGVAPETLERHGAVSAETAAAMAEGVAERVGADLGLSITGIAGPDGGSDAKPVGLVWFGVRWAGVTHTCERLFPRTSRERIQRYAEQTALHLGLLALRGRLADAGAEPFVQGTAAG